MILTLIYLLKQNITNIGYQHYTHAHKTVMIVAERFFWLVTTYVICERLSVMQRHPESVKAKFVLKILRTP